MLALHHINHKLHQEEAADGSVLVDAGPVMLQLPGRKPPRSSSTQHCSRRLATNLQVMISAGCNNWHASNARCLCLHYGFAGKACFGALAMPGAFMWLAHAAGVYGAESAFSCRLTWSRRRGLWEDGEDGWWGWAPMRLADLACHITGTG